MTLDINTAAAVNEITIVDKTERSGFIYVGNTKIRPSLTQGGTYVLEITRGHGDGTADRSVVLTEHRELEDAQQAARDYAVQEELLQNGKLYPPADSTPQQIYEFGQLRRKHYVPDDNDYGAVLSGVAAFLEFYGITSQDDRGKELMWELSSSYHNPLVMQSPDQPLSVHATALLDHLREDEGQDTLRQLSRLHIGAQYGSDNLEHQIKTLKQQLPTLEPYLEKARFLRRHADICQVFLDFRAVEPADKYTQRLAALRKCADTLTSQVSSIRSRIEHDIKTYEEFITNLPVSSCGRIVAFDPKGSRLNEKVFEYNCVIAAGTEAYASDLFVSDLRVCIPAHAISKQDFERLAVRIDPSRKRVREHIVGSYWDEQVMWSTQDVNLLGVWNDYAVFDNGDRLLYTPAEQLAYVVRITKANRFRMKNDKDAIALVLYRKDTAVALQCFYPEGPELDLQAARDRAAAIARGDEETFS